MKAIIFAKSTSTRVRDKNYREFHDGKSLVDITIEKVLRCLPGKDIFLSCESEAKKSVAEKWGIQFLLRDEVLCHNETPLTRVLPEICAQVPGDGDIMWCQVIEPLFDQYGDCIETWERTKAEHDSLVVLHQRHGYFLDKDMKPLGFGFGNGHVPSQHLKPGYQLTFTLAIMSQRSLKATGYYVGARPHWFIADNTPMDIDTEEDYSLAQFMYQQKSLRDEIR